MTKSHMLLAALALLLHTGCASLPKEGSFHLATSAPGAGTLAITLEEPIFDRRLAEQCIRRRADDFMEAAGCGVYSVDVQSIEVFNEDQPPKDGQPQPAKQGTKITAQVTCTARGAS